MAKTLYFLRFNNYYNRQLIPKYGTSWYRQLQIGFTVGVQLFNYGDGINTTQIVNTVDWNDADTSAPDYCVVEDDLTLEYSRWYVMEWKYTRLGQYQVTLKRDVLADNYDAIMQSPMLIQKGYISASDSAIFNYEGQNYNKIKTSENLLYDETKVPWIIGYIPRDAVKDTAQEVQAELTTPFYNLSYATLDEFYSAYPYLKGSTNRTAIKKNPNVIYNIRGSLNVPISQEVVNIAFNKIGLIKYNPQSFGEKSLSNYPFDNTGYGWLYVAKNHTFGTGKIVNTENRIAVLTYNSYINVMDDLEAAVNTAYSYDPAAFQTLLGLSGKVIRIGSNGTYKYYTVNVGSDFVQEEVIAPASVYNILYQNLADGILIPKNSNNNYVLSMTYDDYSYTLSEFNAQVKVTIPKASDRNTLKDAPYDMFCIPYGTLDIYRDGIKIISGTNKEAGIAIATAIASTLGDATVYDLQLLPYCPLRNMINANGEFDYNSEYKGIADIYMTQGSTSVAVNKLFFCDSNTFSFNIPLTLTVDNYKLENECNMYRLCSPNYNGAFEFNLAKNGGMEYVEVDCTYKPYNPYIKLNPNFKRLYGSDFNDARGLICGGDFSIDRLSSAWANYQLQNKNYQNIFDREIQSVELQNKYARIQDIANTVSGSISAGITGGGLSGIPGVGIASGVLSAGAGVADTIMNENLRREQINRQKDLFNYNLQNIQALPYSLAKTSSFNINSKYVPFLEFYTCTEEEKQTLLDKLKWQGMTIMRTGYIPNYLDTNAEETYIEATPLRLNIKEDAHTAQEIAKELQMGVYIKGGIS